MSTRRAFAFALAATLTFASNAFPAGKPAASATPDWIARSNADAQPLLKVFGDFGPEFAARLGVKGYDDRVSSFPLDAGPRFRQAIGEARDGLKAKFAQEKDPQVQQDLKIMIETTSLQIDTSLLNEKYLLPYTNVGQTIFFGEFNLLQDQVDAKRRPSALARLKRYTGLENGYTPVTTQAKAQFEKVMGDKKLLGPFKGQVDQDLSNTASYVDGIRKLYAKYKIGGADKALDALDAQLKDYDAWIKSTVMPLARDDFKLPPELYADNLKNVGLDIAPDDLIHKAELAYAEIRNEMRAIAPLVAKEHHIESSDYRDVIRALKKDQMPRDKIEPTYHEVIGKIEDIIRREHIVTLPERAMLMRVASEAETAAQPAPHMDPPPLIGNKGERGTFVLTLGNPSTGGNAAESYDDFNHEFGTWTLTAHEGRPGHELQFSAMVERGVSLARSLFAFNSVNVEGWALYSEAEMKPFEPLEGQLFALQARLQRAARAILDPMVNLGRISPERAKEVLTDEVVLSPAYARQEIDRYTFRAPGQATSYFYGYTKLMELRAETEIKLGKKFNRQAFNDFVIGQGLLPPPLLRDAVETSFIPEQSK
ncbi:MAG TPA: DUF885 domain-containing protein [Rhodanobacteraceae bacterium]|jgi:uncharacterized protein (DUF885 family)|nr:DUF885 domain-containing protein [Rhodanobacteraceae bacterium]